MNSIKIEIEMPEEALRYIDQKDKNYQKKVQELLMYQLIKEDKISYGKAAEILEMSKIEYITDLSKMGIAYFDSDIAEVLDDVETINSYMKEQ